MSYVLNTIFANCSRAEYVENMQKATKPVRIFFRSERAVNDALRLVIELRKVSGSSTRVRRRGAV